MKFDLKTLSSYDEESLIAELRRVASVIPTGKLTSSQFDRYSKVHSSTVRRRFGGWREALSAAGLANRYDDSSEPISREEIINHLKTLSNRFRRNYVTKQELNEYAGISDKPIRRIFGSYRTALEAAGLKQTPGGVRYTDEECFENMLLMWTALGRQPYYAEMKNPHSKVGPKAYVSRWGSWRAALKAFVERANEDVSAYEQSKPDLKEKASSPLHKRTPHEISLGLRYTVLKRDRFRCVLCGRSPATDISVVLNVDHILPWSKGGETVIANLRSVCRDCNLGKGNALEKI